MSQGGNWIYLAAEGRLRVVSQELHKRTVMVGGRVGGGPGRGWALFSREESPRERCWEGMEERMVWLQVSAHPGLLDPLGSQHPSSWRPQGALQLSLCHSADRLGWLPSSLQ